MEAGTVDVLSAGRSTAAVRIPGSPVDELWIRVADLERATGWALKPEGLCRDSACVITPPVVRERWLDAANEAVCASGLWEALGRPVLHDASRSVWMLGEAAADRRNELMSLQAPDFTLPDIDGNLHSLSDYRGKKVLLVSWASW
jgi:hypothetical protein